MVWLEESWRDMVSVSTPIIQQLQMRHPVASSSFHGGMKICTVDAQPVSRNMHGRRGEWKQTYSSPLLAQSKLLASTLTTLDPLGVWLTLWRLTRSFRSPESYGPSCSRQATCFFLILH